MLGSVVLRVFGKIRRGSGLSYVLDNLGPFLPDEALQFILKVFVAFPWSWVLIVTLWCKPPKTLGAAESAAPFFFIIIMSRHESRTLYRILLERFCLQLGAEHGENAVTAALAPAVVVK